MGWCPGGARGDLRRSPRLTDGWAVTKRSDGAQPQDKTPAPLVHTLLVLRRQLVLVDMIRRGPQTTASLRAWAVAMRCVAFRLDDIASRQERAEDGAAVVSD